MNNSSICVEAQSLVASALTPMLILDFILGLPGNMLALWLFTFKAPWKTSTVCFLNLVLADVMLLIGLPFQIDSLLRGEWIFGDYFCRINLFMLSVNQSASIFFMTALVVDRFFRIVHPLHQICRMSIKRTVMVACGLWMVVVAFRIPLLVTSRRSTLKTSRNSFLCQNIDLWTESGTGMRVQNFISIMEFVFAFILVLFFSLRILYYIKGNKRLREHRRVKRTIYLLLLVFFIFTFCFLPGYITGLISVFAKDVSCSSSVGQVFSLFLGLAYLNGALDPILYTLSSACFRDTLKGLSNSTGATNFKLSVKESRKPRRP